MTEGQHERMWEAMDLPTSKRWWQLVQVHWRRSEEVFFKLARRGRLLAAAELKMAETYSLEVESAEGLLLGDGEDSQ
jgi:hypothetical protein